MTTPFRTAAAAALAVLVAGSAHAATFDFTFYDLDRGLEDGPDRPVPEGSDVQALVLVEDRMLIGSGEMSYDGAVQEGVTDFGDLNNLVLSFAIGDEVFTQSDIMSTGGVEWSVTNRGSFFSGAFIRSEFDEGLRTDARVQAEPVCGLVGSVLLYNGNACFTASPGDGFPDEFVIYEADGMVLSRLSAVPALGEYEAVARVSAVPLPASLPMLALALGGVGFMRSRRS